MLSLFGEEEKNVLKNYWSHREPDPNTCKPQSKTAVCIIIVVESRRIMTTCKVLITTSKQARDGCLVRETMYKKIQMHVQQTQVIFPDSSTTGKAVHHV